MLVWRTVRGAAVTPTHPHLAAPPDTVDDDPLVAELMTDHIVAIVPEARLKVALRLMAANHVRHLPVVDGGRCVGVLLDTDIAHLLAYTPAAMHLPPLAVAEVCRRVPVLTPQDRRTTAATRMRELDADAAVVVDGDRLVGLVTASDIVRSLARPE
jgi:CBS domain-containing protein